MIREFTCIICPNGCWIRADVVSDPEGALTVRSMEGALCPRGEAYVKQELTQPCRSIATSVAVKGGILPLASVRLTNPIPKAGILDAMREIRTCCLKAPVSAGTVVIKNILGYDSDVIVTRSVPARPDPEDRENR
ncbi:DUF1667 domain-containing protein [Lachnospiraceae bacterium 54-53]